VLAKAAFESVGEVRSSDAKHVRREGDAKETNDRIKQTTRPRRIGVL
jgi:hypothetical protein